jgi:hypothetical protein
MIIIAEINILRKYEDKQHIDKKIDRQMTKLHSIWFKGNALGIDLTQFSQPEDRKTA